jgi:predicted MFS family arabinose efflux permease
VTAFVGGISLGSALAGLLVEGPGHSTAFVVAAAFAGLGALLVFVRRRTFVTAVPA